MGNDKGPINEYIDAYEKSGTVRLHMPGHKGRAALKSEDSLVSMYKRDITEIEGADSLYAADGIIRESEKRAAALFGSRYTFYSAGGSSQSIKAMCMMALEHHENLKRREHGAFHAGNPIIVAGRNAHKSFVYASGLLRFDINWLMSENISSICECTVSPAMLEKRLKELEEACQIDRVAAVYITSPDYLGNMQDISGIAKVVHKYKKLLLVDNAHGAYLAFLKEGLHPISLGADMTADSAHKTLPVLTGGSYLHISCDAPKGLEGYGRSALEMFGSTSPSYLIMDSMDSTASYLEKQMKKRDSEGKNDFDICIDRIKKLGDKLNHLGFRLKKGTLREPMKLTLERLAIENPPDRPTIESSSEKSTIERRTFEQDDLPRNSWGKGLAALLREKGIECEFADNDNLVLMFSPMNSEEDFEKTENAFVEIAHDTGEADEAGRADEAGEADNTVTSGNYLGKTDILDQEPEAVYQFHEIMTHAGEWINTDDAAGRVALEIPVSCPPAVLPVVPGERITPKIVEILKYYEIQEVKVLKS